MKKPGAILLFLIAAFSSLILKAQALSEIVKLQAIANNLTAYLQKAGIRNLTIGYSANDANANIKLVLVKDKTEQQKIGLNSAAEDAFSIESTTRSLYIAAATTSAVQNGVYWYLQYLGFRHYFPNQLWHVTPALQSAFKPVKKVAIPSYNHRRIWYAYGTGSDQADAAYDEWFKANLLGGINVSAGHAYDAIVARNKAVFLQHPEYFAQKVEKGKTPPDPKFDVANEALVQLCIQDAFLQIQNAVQKKGMLPDMISMDPSDGGGFSTSNAALKIGGPSEQTFYLANRVARAVRQEYPSVKVGLYAYFTHAVPPSFPLESNIVVLIATAMNQSAYRTDELIAAWKKKNVTIGVRDYYGVMAWDWDMPGQPNGSKISYVSQLKSYHTAGIRLFSAETNIGWISRGLGHYIATQLLWDVNVDIGTVKQAFFKNMFGNAALQMQQLFDTWQVYKQPVPFEGDLYEWSQLIEIASAAEKRDDVQSRLNQIKQYLHYAYLFVRFQKSTTDENLTALLNYAYRIQHTGTVASYPLFRRLANSAVKGKPHMRFDDKQAVWKRNNEPVLEKEINSDFYADMLMFNRNNKTAVTMFPEKFSSVSIGNPKNKTTAHSVRLRGTHKIIFQLNDANASINLSSGLIKSNQYKTLRLTIFPYEGSLDVTAKSLLYESITPKQPLRPVSLGSLKPGTYIAFIDDAKAGFTMSFTGNVRYGIVADLQNNAWTFARNNLVFAVDEANEFIIKNNGVATLISPKGRIIDLQKQKGVFTVKVAAGEKGLWKLSRQSGVFGLQGVLPLVSSEETFLLRKDQ